MIRISNRCAEINQDLKKWSRTFFNKRSRGGSLPTPNAQKDAVFVAAVGRGTMRSLRVERLGFYPTA